MTPVDQQMAMLEGLLHDSRAAKSSAATIVACCDSEESRVLEAATSLLEGLGPPDPEELEALSKLLARPGRDISYWSATLLGRLGSAAEAAVPRLTQAAAQHPDLAAQQRAVWALGKVGKRAASALPDLIELTHHTDSRLARLAEQAIQQIEGP